MKEDGKIHPPSLSVNNLVGKNDSIEMQQTTAKASNIKNTMNVKVEGLEGKKKQTENGILKEFNEGRDIYANMWNMYEITTLGSNLATLWS